MTPSEQNVITERLRTIMGAGDIRIGRVADLIWIAMKGTDGRDYALHLQTFFRFCSREAVLVTDSDKYQPASPEVDLDSGTFDWDVQGNNVLDKWCEEFNRTLSGSVTVTSVEINRFGDLKVCFGNSLTLFVYVETTSEDECWRFFEWHGEGEHLVITGRGIEPQEEE